jgi:trimethylamine---corrinoid protein Co-methyltransferase
MSERAMLSMLMGLSGSDILGGAGQLEVATVLSPLQLIIDNEVIGMVRQLMRGVEITDDTLAWDVLAETRPGDQFLTSDHTFRHCRDVHRPGVFSRPTREVWEGQGKKDVLERALEHYRTLMGKEKPYQCDSSLSREIEAIVAAADKHLVA